MTTVRVTRMGLSVLAVAIAFVGVLGWNPGTASELAAVAGSPAPLAEYVPPINVEFNSVGGQEYANTGTTPLIVGWGNPDQPKEEVGLVTVTVAAIGAELWMTVTYDADPGWELATTHVWVGDDEADVPWNIPPGQATSITAEPGATPEQRTHLINLSGLGLDLVPGSDGVVRLFVAAHADMSYEVSGLPSFEYRLPSDPVLITLAQPSTLGAYLDASVSGAGTFDGVYRAWCVDPSRRVPYDQSIPMTLISSYSTDLADLEQLLGIYQHRDLLNLLINTDWGTVLSSSLAAMLDPLDVQVAIWQLIDLDEARWAPGAVYDEPVVVAILAYLDDYQELYGSFEPGDGDVVAVIADPNNGDPAGTMQIIILELPVSGSYTRNETAWGLGTEAPGRNWAMYFEFDYHP